MMETEQGPVTRFGLMRHGKTIWNAEKRIQGSGDSPLTEEGVSTCRKWGSFLSDHSTQWHRLIVSPLQRTIDTAHILNENLGLPVDIETGFREQDWGDWEGLRIEDIKTDFPHELEKRIGDGWNFKPPGGESRQEVLERVLGAIRYHASRCLDQNVLVITHLGVIKSLLYHIENREFLPTEPKILWKERFHLIGYADNGFWLEQTNIRLSDTL